MRKLRLEDLTVESYETGTEPRVEDAAAAFAFPIISFPESCLCTVACPVTQRPTCYCMAAVE